MEQALRAIQQAIIAGDYLCAQQIIQQCTLQQFARENTRFNLFSLTDRSQEPQQLFNRAVHFLDQQDYQNALYLFHSLITQTLATLQESIVQRSHLPERTNRANPSYIGKRIRSSQEGGYDNLPLSKNCVREFRVDSPPPLPPVPPTSPVPSTGC